MILERQWWPCFRGQCVQEGSREGGDSRKAAHGLEKFNCSRTERNWRVAVGGQGEGGGLLSEDGASGAGVA